MELDLQGNIERFTLPEVFQLIASARKSGTLAIQREDSIVMVYFKDGDVVYGYGPRQTFHLGQLLKERGLITAQQLEEAVGAQARTDNSKRLGEILVARRFIDRADLETVVRQQIEELLFTLLGWQSGTFKFYESQFPTDEEITVNLSVENVVLEGLRRLDEMNMVKETLPDRDAVYTIAASQAGRTRAVTMRSVEWNVMALVDGRRSVNEICMVSPIDQNETLTRLAQLKLAGIITKTERQAAGPVAQPVAPLEQAVQRLAELFENYLTEKSNARLSERRITTTYVGENG
ncbi:MAG TPA: DUF4388 domain-containing protein [Candidatus Deferrimicrobium sp.]|nr:DUF4388 domain-containing protein [Candidatus Deferrimicrobium sp.]